MALWQFEFNIIPKGRSDWSSSKVELLSWKDISISTDMNAIVSLILPNQKSWSNGIKLYGKDDGTCLEFIFEDDKLDELLCRLDLRNLTKKC